MGKRQLSYKDYTIGWVCALSLEQTAAMYMLDERHPDLPNSTNDHNAYTLGKIGNHNVVIAGLPKGRADNNNAATVAAQMLSTFPNIRMTLMVGVGGGIPQMTRLGDVVICSPSDTNAGVIQWDKGKQERGGFKRLGCLTGPPRAGLTALSRFEADPVIPQKIHHHLTGIDKRFLKSGDLEDILFESDYDHVDNARDCSGCDKERRVKREPSNNFMHPKVHYGLIASGNKKIKDARLRDWLYEENHNNLLCIEMEAAGLMDDFHCVVIRGICDYADSHANDKWQNYAAAVAAACAKTYLGVVQEYENNRPQSVQASFASDNARHAEENENSRGNNIQYHTADSPPLTPTKFESPVASATPMLEWKSGAYSHPGEEKYDESQLIGSVMEMMLEKGIGLAALKKFFRDGSQHQQAHAPAEEIGGTSSINGSSTPPLSPQHENHEPRSQPQNSPGVQRRNSAFVSTQSMPGSGPSDPIQQVPAAKTWPLNNDPTSDLFEAIEEGDIATIKKELENGIDLDILDEFGRTPLWRAVEIGKLSVIQLLLDNGADFEAQNLRKQNILDWALKKGKQDIVNMVIAIMDAKSKT